MQPSNDPLTAGKRTDKTDDRDGPRRGAIPTPKKIIEKADRYVPPSTPESAPPERPPKPGNS
jgi:hypothetical protein